MPRATRLTLALLLSSLLGSASARADVFLSEFLAINQSGLRDSDGDTSDWIEVYNAGPASVDLAGWYLSDQAEDLRLWRFPAGVELPAEGRVLVFASGKDRLDLEELHANFSLTGAGEYLALVAPDGAVVHEYAPYPPQRPDASYGLERLATELVAQGSDLRWLVPGSDLGSAWREPGFAPDAAWLPGRSGLGFQQDEGGGGDVPLAVHAWSFDGDLRDTVSGDSAEHVGGAPDYVADPDGNPGSALHFDGSNYVVVEGDALPIYNQPAYTVAMWVRGEPQRDRRVFSEGSDSNNTPLFTIGTEAGGGTGQVDIFLRFVGGGSPNHRLSQGVAFDGEWHHIAWVDDDGDAALYIDGLRDPANFDYAKQDMPLNITSIGSVLRGSSCCEYDGDLDEVLLFDRVLLPEEIAALAGGAGPGSSTFARHIETDVASEMLGAQTSLFARIPFAAVESDQLLLSMRSDDGFVAWLNGVEVARRNTPAVVNWDARSPTELDEATALTQVSYDLSDRLDLLLEGENVLALQALNFRVDDPDLLLAPALLASGGEAREERYFRPPTPGESNGGGSFDFVRDTVFSVDRGFFEAPFDVEIVTETEGATIRYTTDGSAPTRTTGEVYTGPITIDTTTVLRAAAFREGFEPTNVDTQTYLFLDDVIRQRRPSGYPTTWAGNPADYDMDPDIGTDESSPDFDPQLRDDLMAIPTMSLVMSQDDFVGSRGLYQNPQNRGAAWERPVSAEFFTAEGDREFQVDCAARISGNSSARPIEGKHSFRLLFKSEYGASKLDFDLFGGGVKRFDTLTLRCMSTDSWHFKDGGSRYRRRDSQYIRDAYLRDLQWKMGYVASRSTYVHLYVNGIYWGLYNPSERPDDSFGAEHFGGEKEDWDAYKDAAFFKGSSATWSRLFNLANQGFSSLQAYLRVQGLDAQGSPDPAIENLLDVPHLIDYMILHLWGGSEDWPHHNWYAVRHREGLSGGWKFITWDQEIILDPAYRNRINVSNSNSPAFLYSRLRANPEFRLLFGDHVRRHFFHGGILTDEVAQAHYLERADEIGRAIVGESARWGDFREDVPDPSRSPAELYTRERHWFPERQRVLNTIIPESRRRALDRFRQAGLYPDNDPPTFTPHGGRVDPDRVISQTALSGTIWFTTNGSDPRLLGGDTAPEAQAAGFGESTTLVDEGAPVRAIVPVDDSEGLDWIALDYDDAAWLEGTTGVGYERTSGYEDLIGLDLMEVMDGENASAYLRVPFQFSGDAPDSLTLRMKYDDGFVCWLNGVEVARQNAPAVVAWNEEATNSHRDSEAIVFEDLDITDFVGLLREGDNVLAIQGFNSSPTSSDFLIVPALRSAVASEGSGLRFDRTTELAARVLSEDGEWSALEVATFGVDLAALRVTELMYHPPADLVDRGFAPKDYEFVELQNIGDGPLDLSLAALEEGVRFEFEAGRNASRDVPPGGFLLLVSNLEAFQARYGDLPGVEIAQYEGSFSNGGERLVLRDAIGEPILDFTYDDLWYPVTDGQGFSLEIVDAGAPAGTWSEAASWQPSGDVLGSPGTGEGGAVGGLQRPGDYNQDATLDISDAISLLNHLFTGNARALPCDGGDFEGPGNLALLDADGDGNLTLTDSIRTLTYLFLAGPPPVGGSACRRIEGCPDACR